MGDMWLTSFYWTVRSQPWVPLMSYFISDGQFLTHVFLPLPILFSPTPELFPERFSLQSKGKILTKRGCVSLPPSIHHSTKYHLRLFESVLPKEILVSCLTFLELSLPTCSGHMSWMGFTFLVSVIDCVTRVWPIRAREMGLAVKTRGKSLLDKDEQRTRSWRLRILDFLGGCKFWFHY